MGIGSNQNQVYYDPESGRYYTGSGNGFFQHRNYLNQPTFNQNPTPSSNATKLIEQAMAAQANPVSMAQLFPYMNYGGTNNTGMGGLLDMIGQGSSGAGRFLGASNPLTSNNSTTM